MGKPTKRYIATVTFYCYGEDAKEAFESAEKTVNEIKSKEDNEAEIELFHFHDFGSTRMIRIDLCKLKQTECP
jgi:hypothetical protein